MANRATDEKAESSENADLISRLPDDLLTRILSFVCTKTSVGTCVLSKRWSRLWISVPNIDFSSVLDGTTVTQAQSENFIDRFLSLNTAVSVRTIQFYVEKETEVSRVNARIAAFGDHDAEKVRLFFPHDRSFDTSDELGIPIYSIPDNFFIQNNLVNLHFQAVVLKVPRLVCFPNLKTMKLIFVQFFDDNSLKNLLSGSPVIETLYIGLDKTNVSRTLYICSSSLRNFCLNMLAPDEDYVHKIVIDTPNLRHLSVCDFTCSTYNMINLSSLLVSVNVDYIKEEACLELLTHITHVKTLVLGVDFSRGEFDSSSLVSMPIFNNLIRLELKFNWMNHSETLFHLFKCAPNLNCVTFTLNYLMPCSPARAWSEPHEVPQCFLSSIESVEIKYIEDVDQEMPMISYILKNAMVLKNLSLHLNPCRAKDLAKENMFLSTLLTLPRSSAIATCHVK